LYIISEEKGKERMNSLERENRLGIFCLDLTKRKEPCSYGPCFCKTFMESEKEELCPLGIYEKRKRTEEEYNKLVEAEKQYEQEMKKEQEKEEKRRKKLAKRGK
jgi:hypothetical protein